MRYKINIYEYPQFKLPLYSVKHQWQQLLSDKYMHIFSLWYYNIR